jgi:hypothetical protein
VEAPVPPAASASDAPAVAQLAPAPPTIRKTLPYPADFGNDADSESIAEEVAAILSTTLPPPPRVSTPKAARPTVINYPSERWLREASAHLESLPEGQRAAAFQKIIEHYRMMRIEERTTPVPR